MTVKLCRTDREKIPLISLVPFLLITFGLAWGIIALYVFFPEAMIGLFGALTGEHPLFFLAVYAPGIAAFAVVIHHTGIGGLRRYFRINFGPWDRRFHREPFFGEWPSPAGANFYPLDLTDQEQTLISAPGSGFDGLFTMVRRDDAGGLAAVPYSEHFKDELTAAAALLKDLINACSIKC